MRKICILMIFVFFISYGISKASEKSDFGYNFESSQYIFYNNMECIGSLRKPIKKFNDVGWKCSKSTRFGNICIKTKKKYITKYQFRCIGNTMYVNGFVSKIK